MIIIVAISLIFFACENAEEVDRLTSSIHDLESERNKLKTEITTLNTKLQSTETSFGELESNLEKCKWKKNIVNGIITVPGWQATDSFKVPDNSKAILTGEYKSDEPIKVCLATEANYQDFRKNEQTLDNWQAFCEGAIDTNSNKKLHKSGTLGIELSVGEYRLIFFHFSECDWFEIECTKAKITTNIAVELL